MLYAARFIGDGCDTVADDRPSPLLLPSRGHLIPGKARAPFLADATLTECSFEGQQTRSQPRPRDFWSQFAPAGPRAPAGPPGAS